MTIDEAMQRIDIIKDIPINDLIEIVKLWKNERLTYDELKDMVGEYVWVDVVNNYCRIEYENNSLIVVTERPSLRIGVEKFELYRRKPDEFERRINCG